jgi:hypothetical protein
MILSTLTATRSDCHEAEHGVPGRLMSAASSRISPLAVAPRDGRHVDAVWLHCRALQHAAQGRVKRFGPARRELRVVA